uniref:Putative glycosyl transferase n=1 Tax=Streptococcus pneumoniae TaxID=1313 RepID=Q4JYX0_STREE|nr:putative glycosyl transferase [Streptococcus pneumoniae]
MFTIYRAMKKIIIIILSLPKIFYINLKCLPLNQAVKLPIYVHFNTRLMIKGDIKIIDTHLSRFTIILGKDGSNHISPHESRLFIYDGGQLILGRNILLSSGFNLCIEQGGTVKLGDNVSFNRNSSIFCKKQINIGKNSLFGWNCSLRDNNGHRIYYQDNCIKSEEVIVIGENCWITADSVILKNSVLPFSTVVATGSLVNKEFNQSNILIAGRPARIIREDIKWER